MAKQEDIPTEQAYLKKHKYQNTLTLKGCLSGITSLYHPISQVTRKRPPQPSSEGQEIQAISDQQCSDCQRHGHCQSLFCPLEYLL